MFTIQSCLLRQVRLGGHQFCLFVWVLLSYLSLSLFLYFRFQLQVLFRVQCHFCLLGISGGFWFFFFVCLRQVCLCLRVLRGGRFVVRFGFLLVLLSSFWLFSSVCPQWGHLWVVRSFLPQLRLLFSGALRFWLKLCQLLLVLLLRFWPRF